MRSTLFDAKIEGNELVLDGRGWGHGVGMCQWGVYTQARRRIKYREILEFYYSGADIVQVETKS